MRATTTATLLAFVLYPLAISARSLSLFGDQAPISPAEDLVVPGSNPLTFCSPPDDDILTIHKVDLVPNPPVPGKTLTIQATGTFAEQIEEGATVNLQVKYGYIRLINEEADLCEQIKNVDMECPIEKGNMVILKEVDLPKEIPPGKYTVNAEVLTKDGRRITCLDAVVYFDALR